MFFFSARRMNNKFFFAGMWNLHKLRHGVESYEHKQLVSIYLLHETKISVIVHHVSTLYFCSYTLKIWTYYNDEQSIE